jgi:muconolactone delta-isomerase
MKILAMDHLLPGVTMEQVMSQMKAEAAQAWELMKAGVIRENYLRGDGKGAVAILECSSVDEAKAIMNTFPLVKAGLIEFEFIPLELFTPLQTLFDPENL